MLISLSNAPLHLLRQRLYQSSELVTGLSLAHQLAPGDPGLYSSSLQIPGAL